VLVNKRTPLPGEGMNASTAWLQHREQARLAVALCGVALAGGVVQAKVRDGATMTMAK
jgi:hypothetical protein